MAHFDVTDDQVDEMVRHDLVEPAVSPWASNVVLVRKKHGTYRLCVDYQALNSVSYKDTYPLHHIDTCLIYVCESRGPRVPGSTSPGVRKSRGLRVPGSASPRVHESLDPFPLLGGYRKKAARVEVSIGLSLAFRYLVPIALHP